MRERFQTQCSCTEIKCVLSYCQVEGYRARTIVGILYMFDSFVRNAEQR